MIGVMHKVAQEPGSFGHFYLTQHSWKCYSSFPNGGCIPIQFAANRPDPTKPFSLVRDRQERSGSY